LSDVLLNALNIDNDTPRHHHHHESEAPRARSASSSPRAGSPVNQRISDTNIKPPCLYVSNWTDDEKCKRSKDRMRFNETLLAERFISKKKRNSCFFIY